MAQTGYTPISIYYSSTASATPTAGNLVAGELAINTADGKLFYKDSAGVVQVIGTKGGVGSSTTTQVLYNSSGLVVGSANMTFDGSTLTTLNLAYTGTLTGGTGVVNLGSGQFYKDASGNVGIGTSSPNASFRLDVNGNSGIRIQGGTVGSVAIRSASTYSNFVSFNESNVADRGVIGFAGASANMSIRTNGAYDLTTGTLSATVNQYGIGVGTAVPSSGVGVSFPATQSASSDANTLDDYEEGTFTPTATAGTPGAVPPTFAYDFRYTKIGRVVSITGYFYINTAGTASGNLNFTGFPFTTGNFGYAPVGTATEQALTNQLCQMRVENNSTSGRVTAVTGGGVVWTNGGQYVVSITYIAA